MVTSRSWSGVLVLAMMAALPLKAMSAHLLIEFGGADHVKLGTPLTKLRLPLEQPIRKTDQQPSGQCFYASPKKDPRFVLMFQADVLTRIDVLKPGLRTVAGVGVGDPVSRVQAVYGQAVKEEPDFYDERERYLTVASEDGKYAIRFMTAEGKISAIISGTAESVKYVEGCL
ncbi:MAG: hypothetical protein ACJ8GW_10400 [Massilia sp.]